MNPFQLFTSIPTTSLGWTISIVFTLLALISIYSQVRKNDMTVLRDANTDLRATLADNNTRIVSLESEVKILTEKVGLLERRNKTLEDLVITALKQYFFENPTAASTLKDIVTTS